MIRPGGSTFDMRHWDGLSGKDLVDKGVLPQCEGLYAWQQPSVDAVLISHAHIDHYGFLNHVHPDIPVYLSEGTHKLIDVTSTFGRNIYTLRNTLNFSWPCRFPIGAFTIKPHLVDHSSFSAFAFEFEANGKRVFYSGDFREHGYLKKAMKILYREVRPGVDALIMEGTLLGRKDEQNQTEAALSKEAAKLCKDSKKAILIYQSGQNISRAFSFFMAARQSKRLFVPDVYTAHVLAEMGNCRGGENLPYPGKVGFDDVRVWYPHKLTQRLHNINHGDIPLRYYSRELRKPEMPSILDKIMLFVRPGMETELRTIEGLEGSTLIYSLWEGYRRGENTRSFLETVEELGIKVVSLHTSGHADIPALENMTKKLQPKQIVPIHTLHADQYEQIFEFPVTREEYIEI